MVGRSFLLLAAKTEGIRPKVRKENRCFGNPLEQKLPFFYNTGDDNAASPQWIVGDLPDGGITGVCFLPIVESLSVTGVRWTITIPHREVCAKGLCTPHPSTQHSFPLAVT